MVLQPACMHVFSAAERLAWQRATARYLSISPCSSISSATSSHLQRCEEACDHSGGRGGGRQISEEAAYRNSLSISINPGYGLALPVPAAQVETGVSHAGRPLPAFLSGKMQQCFVSMPGNTFARQKMRKEREGEERGGGVRRILISKQLKVDSSRGAQWRSSELLLWTTITGQRSIPRISCNKTSLPSLLRCFFSAGIGAPGAPDAFTNLWMNPAQRKWWQFI